MALRAGHGNGAGQLRVEVLPCDELPAPVPDETAPLRRRPDGTIADSETARRLGAMGGAAKCSRTRLVSALGLAELAADADFVPYRSAGDAFVVAHLASLASQSGGEVGPGASSIVASAGLQLAASRFAADRAAAAGDPKLFHLASQLADSSRQNILAAYELSTREAAARKALRPSNPLAQFMPPRVKP